jgi:HemX protein
VAFFAAATGYSILVWRRGFTRDNGWPYGLLACAFLANTGALVARGFTLEKCPVTNLFEAVMFISWALVACNLVAGLWPRLRFTSALAAPLLFGMGVFGLQPLLDRPAAEVGGSSGLVSLHATLILLAYGTFGLGAVAAGLYLVQEHDLKFHKTRAVLSRLPSIERLEKVVARSLGAGLVLLTAGLLLAPLLIRRTDVAMGAVRADPKVMWSVLVWVAYVGLLIARWRGRWGARPVAWGALGSFAFVILTFWGTNLLSPLHH